MKSNDRRRARLEAMRHVLSLHDYAGKCQEVVGEPDPLIVGPPPALCCTTVIPAESLTTSSGRAPAT